MRLVVEFRDADALRQAWRDHLGRGGAFVPGASAALMTPCTFVLRAPGGDELELPATVVFASPDGLGLALRDSVASLRERIGGWASRVLAPVAAAPAGAPVAPAPAGAPAAASPPATPPAAASPPAPDPDGAAPAEPTIAGTLAADAPSPDGPPDAPDAPDDGDDDGDDREAPPEIRNIYARLRNLSVPEQLKVAREGEAHERMALERMYGKTVWEALLRNPRLTHPEVARISRMGALPRPLLELIVGNTTWLRSPEVRRALLANRRLTIDMVHRVLRLLSLHELKLAPMQTAYPSTVRDAARRMLQAG